MKIEDVYIQDVYPIIRAFQSRKPSEFQHTDNSNRELERLNMVEGWKTKWKVVPPLPDKHPKLEAANPPDPAFIAYVSLVDDRFHREMYRQTMIMDMKHKIDLHKETQRKLDEIARAKAIASSIEKMQFTFESIRKELHEQVDFNVQKRYEVRDEWAEHQRESVQHRIETNRELKDWQKWNYWHMHDYRAKTDEIWIERKEMSLAKKRLEDLKHESWEKRQLPNYRREMMAFYNPTEIALIFAAHQMAQNYMQGYNQISAIDLPKFATGEAGIRTVMLTSAIKSN